jgi:uncharacterized protein (DUF1810 family)
MSRAYAIRSREEARAYLEHPLLGPRLRECADALLAVDPALDAEEVLGGIDALKVRSSMTLFAHAAPDEEVFTAVLTRFYGGVADPETTRRLN